MAGFEVEAPERLGGPRVPPYPLQSRWRTGVPPVWYRTVHDGR